MSYSMKSNNYKNSVKGLRKLTLGKTNKEVVIKNKKNNFNLLEDAESEDVEHHFKNSNKLTTKTSREKKVITFNDLPEDMICLILSFLSYNTRLAILKNKFNQNYIKTKFEKIPKTIQGINQIWKCAEIAKYILENVLENGSDVFRNLSMYSLKSFKKEKNMELYSTYYIEQFTKIILSAIHHYIKIYKFSNCKNKKIIKYEKKMLTIFAHISIMK